MGKILHNVQDRKEPFDDDKKRLVNWIIGEIIKKLREQDDFKDYFPSEQEKGNIDISSDNSNIEIYLEMASVQGQYILKRTYSTTTQVATRVLTYPPLLASQPGC